MSPAGHRVEEHCYDSRERLTLACGVPGEFRAAVSTKTTGGEGHDWSERLLAAPATVLGAPDFSSFMRLVFPEGAAGAGRETGALTTTGWSSSSLVRRDYETALTLLQRASETFPALLHHCQQLESDLRRLRIDAEGEIAAAKGESQRWRQIAVAMKMHIEESEHQVEILRKRLDAAEERLAAGQTITKAAERQASLALGITTLFHDKIIDAFGVGSPAHATLDAVARGPLKAPELKDESR